MKNRVGERGGGGGDAEEGERERGRERDAGFIYFKVK